ncbi:hypothetical protein GLAREA_06900 [Glarea lozoyensis ATCC 20868]|uniref:Heterokaryon incompatibility domain-containing protein n=1 Tax=Glarea lozoyensis (strain ATCC 20868 / MF5171) TaxID=1116229 RepID=S3D606_GLAL2|nr:uncharacterized protein GLAREA_06900 [Glarea lozoyensis ATCC 20868]EPE33887.1 hypothetical protein GLAREA_06900 [Glarea lozoyensis ATCC 20868]
MAAILQPYIYRPLPSGQHIRLLQLSEAQDLQAGLEGKLTTYELANTPPYECLSYTWGIDPANCSLTLNNLGFSIRQNLQDGLRRLRRSDRAHLLWVDAICIDQLNIPERGSQVSIMRDIFAGADQVVIWLGEEDDDGSTAPAFKLIPILAKLDKTETWNYVVQNAESEGSSAEDLLKDLYSLNRLGSRPWWKRVWVLQEIVVAKEAMLLCGSQVLSWQGICDLHRVYMHLPTSHQLLTSQLDRAWAREFPYRPILKLLDNIIFDPLRVILSHRKWKEKGLTTTLAKLMDMMIHTRYLASDPRDHIYALLGIVQMDLKSGIQPDYNLSMEVLYTSVFKSWLINEGDLTYLSWLRYNNSLHYKNETFPTWVPDFQNRTIKGRFSTRWISRAKRRPKYALLYHASGSQQPSSAPHITASSFENENCILNLIGVEVDTIEDINSYSGNFNLYMTPPERLNKRIDLWRPSNLSKYVGSSEPIKQAFWRTYLKDQTLQGYHEGIRHRHQMRRLSNKEMEDEDWTNFHKVLSKTAVVRKIRVFFMTKKGYMGLGYDTVKEGDIVAVVMGGEVPLVLRPAGDGLFLLIGECYVHGIMDGEVMKGVENGEFEKKRIRIK